jgi:hypothetical protein
MVPVANCNSPQRGGYRVRFAALPFDKYRLDTENPKKPDLASMQHLGLLVVPACQPQPCRDSLELGQLPDCRRDSDNARLQRGGPPRQSDQIDVTVAPGHAEAAIWVSRGTKMEVQQLWDPILGFSLRSESVFKAFQRQLGAALQILQKGLRLMHGHLCNSLAVSGRFSRRSS